jgi:hypothetical protein
MVGHVTVEVHPAISGESMKPRELVQAWVEAFNKRDIAALAAFFSERTPRTIRCQNSL